MGVESIFMDSNSSTVNLREKLSKLVDNAPNLSSSHIGYQVSTTKTSWNNHLFPWSKYQE